jgi:hypothetical protein
MRWPLGVIALLALGGCASAEQRMIATAKTKCAEPISKAPWRGTLSWTARQYPGGSWEVKGALEPQRQVGVTSFTSPGGKGSCLEFMTLDPNMAENNFPQPVRPQP